jgi:hypothetical protein
MKKLLLSAVLLSAFTAVAQLPQAAKPERPTAPTTSNESPEGGCRRFQAVELPGAAGFYWLDSARGDLWKVTPEVKEWKFLGTPRGANNGPNGTYQLFSDRKGGVYILHTDKGDGWWTDGTTWKTLGDLSRRVKE